MVPEPVIVILGLATVFPEFNTLNESSVSAFIVFIRSTAEYLNG
jgi:hypothetical protein